VKGDPEEAWGKIRNKTENNNAPWSQAPVVIVALADGRRQWGTVQGALTFGRHASHLTDGMANTCMLMHLAIASLGLGSQWVTIHIQEPFKRILKVPDLLEVYLIISVGYADMERKPGVRRPLEDIVHYDEYDMSKYMSNKDILDYLASLRQKVMFRYQIKKEDVAKPGK
jgi:nitroreductase